MGPVLILLINSTELNGWKPNTHCFLFLCQCVSHLIISEVRFAFLGDKDTVCSCSSLSASPCAPLNITIWLRCRAWYWKEEMILSWDLHIHTLLPPEDLKPRRQRGLFPVGHFLSRISVRHFLPSASVHIFNVYCRYRPLPSPALPNDLILMILTLVPFACFYFVDAFMKLFVTLWHIWKWSTYRDRYDDDDDHIFSWRQSQRGYTATIAL